MHLNILNDDQVGLLPLLAKFKREYYMVGGTSIALHIGHRLSIDFDLFKSTSIKPSKIISVFREMKLDYHVTLNIDGQLNLVCNQVKFTFFQFEFNIPHEVKVDKYITIPNLLDLAAMKAYALGHRSKWKDYVDLYFIIRDEYEINEISQRARELFGTLFSDKLFRAQLSFFKGINFSEIPVFLPGFEVSEEEVKEFLISVATDI